MWRMWFAVWWLSGIAVWALEAELQLSPGPAGVDIAQVSSDLMLLPAAEKVLPGQLVYVYVALQGEAPPAGTARWEGRLQRLAADGAAAVLPAAEFRAAAGGGMLQPAPDCRSLQLLGGLYGAGWQHSGHGDHIAGHGPGGDAGRSGRGTGRSLDEPAGRADGGGFAAGQPAAGRGCRTG